jgi:geranylgeranyl diphosphate synthase type I
VADPARFSVLLERVRQEVDRELLGVWELARHQHGGYGPAVTRPLEAARELCLRGGKRLRAGLVVAGYLVGGGAGDLGPCLRVCCAVELLHAYFLIHDDWMDQDSLRRGGPAVHAALELHFPSPHLAASGAVLAGDYTLALAQRELSLGVTLVPQRDEVVRRFVAMQLDAVVGQQLDVLGDGSNLDDVYRLKTGSYTVLGPLGLGLALGGAPPALGEALEGFALPLGIAFQLRDDLIGAFGDPHMTGKPRGSDLLAGKRTLLLESALTLADPTVRALLRNLLGDRSATRESIDVALDAIDTTGARAHVEARITELTAQARAALAAFDAPARTLLEGVLAALVDRAS